MQRAIIMSGFLGSGKTSLILRLGKYFAENLGKKAVIIVNEIGEIGVDGDFLKKLGMNSYEITEGCICCTLRRDLESTISDVLSSINPDYVLIEPTGIAFPSVIRKTVRKVGMDALVIGVADAKRFVKLYSDSREFLERQLREAEIIAVNKVDTVSSKAELNLLVELIKQISPNSEIVFTSSKTGEGFDSLVKLLELPLRIEGKIEEFLDSTAESGASWCSAKVLIKFKKPVAGVELKRLGVEMLDRIKVRAGKIQHYKMLISADGALKFGVTGKDESVSVDGELAGWFVQSKLNVLLIDKELSTEQIRRIFEEELMKLAEDLGFNFEFIEHEHGADSE